MCQVIETHALRRRSSRLPCRAPAAVKPLTPQTETLRPGFLQSLGDLHSQDLDPSTVSRSKDLRLKSGSVFLDATGSKPQRQDWLNNPKNKNRPRARCQVSSTKWNGERALEKATRGSCTIVPVGLMRCLGMWGLGGHCSAGRGWATSRTKEFQWSPLSFKPSHSFFHSASHLS